MTADRHDSNPNVDIVRELPDPGMINYDPRQMAYLAVTCTEAIVLALGRIAARMEADATNEADDPVISVAGLGGSRYSEIPLSDREGPDPEPFADVED